MPPVRVIVPTPEAAAEPRAEFWVSDELMAVSVLYDGRMHVRIQPRSDGKPWVVEGASLALALDNAARRIADY